MLKEDNLVARKLVELLASLRFLPYNVLGRDKKAANYLDFRLGTVLMNLSHFVTRQKGEVYATHFSFTTEHLRTPVAWTDLWATKFPNATPDSFTGFYATPFLTVNDNGSAAKKYPSRTLKKAKGQGFLHVTLHGTILPTVSAISYWPIAPPPSQSSYKIFFLRTAGFPKPVSDADIEKLDLSSPLKSEDIATLREKFQLVVLDNEYTRFEVSLLPNCYATLNEHPI